MVIHTSYGCFFDDGPGKRADVLCERADDDGDGNKFNISFEDWDVIGQGTASLSTITVVVNQTEGDEYVTSSLVLSFINTCMRL